MSLVLMTPKRSFNKLLLHWRLFHNEEVNKEHDLFTAYRYFLQAFKELKPNDQRVIALVYLKYIHSVNRQGWSAVLEDKKRTFIQWDKVAEELGTSEGVAYRLSRKARARFSRLFCKLLATDYPPNDDVTTIKLVKINNGVTFEYKAP